MATISISIPDADLTRVVNGVCAFYGYEALLASGAANPETKAQFAKRMIARNVKQCVSISEAATAANTATAGASSLDIS